MLKIKNTNRVIIIDTDTNEVEEFGNSSILSEFIGVPVSTIKSWFRKDERSGRYPNVARYNNYEIRKIKHVYSRDKSKF